MISTEYYPHCSHWYNDIQKIKWTGSWWFPLNIIQGEYMTVYDSIYMTVYMTVYILLCPHWYNDIQMIRLTESSWFPLDIIHIVPIDIMTSRKLNELYYDDDIHWILSKGRYFIVTIGIMKSRNELYHDIHQGKILTALKTITQRLCKK